MLIVPVVVIAGMLALPLVAGKASGIGREGLLRC